jgi:hypothetical protein
VDANDEGALAAAKVAVDELNKRNFSLWRHVLVGIDKGESSSSRAGFGSINRGSQG